MLLILFILTIIILYFIIATDYTFLIFILLLIEPIIFIKFNKYIIIEIPIEIPNGIPIANVIDISNTNYHDNTINYYDNTINY